MKNPLVPNQNSLPAKKQPIDPRSIELIQAGKSQRTRDLYSQNYNRFQEWAQEHQFPYLPTSAHALEQYLHHLIESDRKIATIDLAIQSIKAIHQVTQQPFPAVPFLNEMMRGLKRTKGTKQRQAKPLTTDLIARGLSNENTAMAIRDKALILISFAGALRRSEICELKFEDLDFRPEGLVLHLKKSKTDQEAQGRDVPIHKSHNERMCPVLALQKWLRFAEIEDGCVFRSLRKGGYIRKNITDGSISRIVKKVVSAAGEDSRGYSGHSLRSGYVTEVARRGAQSHQIMMVTGHKSDAMVRKYIRSGRLFMDSISIL